MKVLAEERLLKFARAIVNRYAHLIEAAETSAARQSPLFR